MIYLDNAATSYPKPKWTYLALLKCLREAVGNPSRSSHLPSFRALETIYSVREKVADLFSVNDPELVVLTSNATHSLNLAIKALAKENSHVIISDLEHNSVVRPLVSLRDRIGVEYSEFDSDIDPDISIPPLIRDNTVGIISTAVSNVTGKKINLSKLSQLSNRYNLFLIIDASQAAGHIMINLNSTPCDVLCAPGHKGLFGLQGTGIAIFKSKYRAETLIEGGSGADSINKYMPKYLPEGYEAGTPATPAIVTLGCGIDYINKIGIGAIEDRLKFLTDEMVARLDNIPLVKLYKSGLGIISFNISNLPSSKISSALDQKDICVRGGLHCAPFVHRRLGTLNQGTVRLSFSYLNKIKELDAFYKALKEITREI